MQDVALNSTNYQEEDKLFSLPHMAETLDIVQKP